MQVIKQVKKFLESQKTILLYMVFVRVACRPSLALLGGTQEDTAGASYQEYSIKQVTVDLKTTFYEATLASDAWTLVFCCGFVGLGAKPISALSSASFRWCKCVLWLSQFKKIRTHIIVDRNMMSARIIRGSRTRSGWQSDRSRAGRGHKKKNQQKQRHSTRSLEVFFSMRCAFSPCLRCLWSLNAVGFSNELQDAGEVHHRAAAWAVKSAWSHILYEILFCKKYLIYSIL